MTVFKFLVVCLALIGAPAMSASAVSSNSVSGNEYVQTTLSDSSFNQSDFLDSEALPSVSSDFDSGFYYSSDVDPLADYDSYYGSIGSTYLEYMRGYLSKLNFNDHYVAARVSQTEYIFAFGDLTYDGSFSGNNIRVVSWNTQNNGTFYSSIQPTFTLNPQNFLVYTDLGFDYPSLATSSDVSLRQIVIFIALLLSFFTISDFFVRKGIRSKSKRWRV